MAFPSSSGRVALLFGVLALLSASYAVEGSNLVNVLKNEGQFSIFYKALESSEELGGVEGRTVVNGSSFVIFAPTDDSFAEEFSPEVLACLKTSGPAKGIIVQLLRYMQVTTLHEPVQNAMDLVKQAQDNKVWTVLGRPMLVGGGNNNSVTLKSESGESLAVVNEFRVLDINVTLIPLANGIVIDDTLSNEIMDACFPVFPSSATSVPVSPASSASDPAKKSTSPASKAPASKPTSRKLLK